jgi:hypothetical protein
LPKQGGHLFIRLARPFGLACFGFAQHKQEQALVGDPLSLIHTQKAPDGVS